MRSILKGATDQSVVIRIVDSGDGTPETGVTSGTSGLDLEYRREGATSVDLTESDLAALDSAHSDGGIKHIGNGYYRVDLPDAAVASGANGVLVHGTATGMVVIGCYVHLVDYNPQDAVRLGLTALPNAAAEASGGLPTLSAAQASNGTIPANVHRWLTGTPNALVAGRVDSRPGALADDIITAAAHDESTAFPLRSADTGSTQVARTGADGDTLETLSDQLDTKASQSSVDTVSTNVSTLLTRITSTLFAGITSLAEWLGLIAGKQTGNSTARTELRATGAGSGTYDETTDSLEAARDNVGTAGAGLTAADDAVLAAVAALNNLSAAQVNAEVDTALADIHLDHLLAVTYDPASKPGAADALLNELVESDGGVARYTANALEQAPTGGSAPTVTQIRQEMDANSTQLAAIVADTNELQTDWANGGRLDNILDARASQTSVDDLPTNAELATALAAADDAVLAAIAALNNLSQANIRTAVGLASANLDTQLGDLPTNSELATALAAADDAVLAAIAALNNLSAAQVNAQADLALSDAGVTTVRMAKLDGLPEGVKTNTALDDFPFRMVLTSDHVTGATGKTITATRSIDGGAFAACANSATEIGGGVYKIDLAAADLNGTTIVLRFAAADCDVTEVMIKTTP